MISSSRCTHLLLLLPLMFSFFVMGFVDLVGIASNYAKADYQLTDTTANFLPSLVFFWFLLFSVPTSILMNKIGRKRTLLLSLCVTMAALRPYSIKVLPECSLPFRCLALATH